MTQQTSNWQGLNLDKNDIDFTGALSAKLEHDGGSFISLTFKLKNNSIVRIRKADYGVKVEAEVFPTETKYMVKHPSGIELTFDDEKKAQEIADNIPGSTVDKIEVPRPYKQNILSLFE